MANIPGTPGDDTLTGTASADTITGGDGNDTIYGGGGADSLSGGNHDDLIYGGDGNDRIDGGAGNDTLHGDAGGDSILGGTGDDEIDGGLGNDTVNGGVGHDLIYGGDGTDSLLGGAGNDTIHAGHGDDSVWGEDGDDVIYAGTGNNVPPGGEIYGGAGNDTIHGGTGSDMYWGGTGNDVFLNAADLINGGSYIRDWGLDGGAAFYNDGDRYNNDHIDLSGIFNMSTLATYNALNGTNFTNPLDALNHDLNSGTNNYTINFNGTTMVTPGLRFWNEFGPMPPKPLTWDQTNVCFTRGTLIATVSGQVPVEELEVGNLVLTMDDGYQPIRWIGSRLLDIIDLAMNPRLRPIRVPAGALGHGLPVRDLLVSPQHRVLVRSAVAERMFGDREVLVAAKQLVGVAGIEVVNDLSEVEYWHFMFGAHQVVFSEGAATESLFTGPEALKAVGPEVAKEIFALLPELRDLDPGELPEPARRLVPGRLGRQLALRHIRNGKALVTPSEVE